MTYLKPVIVPNFSPEALTMSASRFVAQAAYEMAGPILEDVLSVQPRFMAAHNELGNCFKGMGEHQRALDAYSSALQLAPQAAELYMNVGSTLIDVGDIKGAASHLITAMTLNPNLFNARWNLAITILSSGNLHDGWIMARDRWLTPKFAPYVPGYPLPYWEGERDAKVLVWGEQGMGERILYCPMLRELAALGCEVYFEADPRFEPIWKRSFPEVNMVHEGKRFDPGYLTHQIALGDLGSYFRDNVEAFPNHNGYLKPLGPLVSQMRAMMRAGAGGKRIVGISWKSGNQEYGSHKGINILDLAEPLLDLGDVLLVNLQYGETADDIAAVKAATGHDVLTLPGIDLRENMEAVAAMMSCCDAIVSVSNTHAHLAGALGVPTHVMLPRHNARFWYWFLDRTDSPWYPSVKLYRQVRHGRWGSVVDQVAEAIRALPTRG